ncbi:rolling circle replication-associated protein [Candidatus Enterococcus murrayae]|uniref:Replication-associated protein ORF2/G2P domain-containing protein n=1 Tax=Candidatus Enterococcus murrayae TaxID=2815321 RepID=A0ABS3HKB2_9ENTE|nr:hypothetical protein [Enterococcus sp. MJM16]MBO0453892.1 hypothetical protein [Enterococcus sp. MJM16]
MYYKIIRSGDVLEVYEMDNTPINPYERLTEKRRELFDSVCNFMANGQNELAQMFIEELLDLDPALNKEKREIERLQQGISEYDRKEARLAQTLRDARNTLRRLAINNFPNNKSTFVTLTVAKNSDDIDYYDEKVKQFIRKLRKDYGKLHYVGVREFQKRGAIHYHLLINYPFIKGFSETEIRKSEVYFKNHYWKQGFVDLKSIEHVDNVGAYISKYMTKDMQDKRLIGRKSYLCSRGLKRSEVITFEKDALIKQHYCYLKEQGMSEPEIDKLLLNEDEFFYSSLHNIHYTKLHWNNVSLKHSVLN